MKQKIVIKVQINCEKCRTKAMTVAVSANGVNSVAIAGNDKDEVVVIGDGVDAAALTICLSKKLSYAKLLTVEEVKPDKKEEDKDKDKDKDNTPPACIITSAPYGHYYPQPYSVVCDPYPTNNCTIM